MRVHWTPSSRADLAAIFDYLAPRNFQAAVDQEDRIHEVVARLARYPRLGRPGQAHDTRELPIARTPYIVVYRVAPAGIEILRVLHGAQERPSQA